MHIMKSSLFILRISLGSKFEFKNQYKKFLKINFLQKWILILKQKSIRYVCALFTITQL